jgi:hypothetical protein
VRRTPPDDQVRVGTSCDSGTVAEAIDLDTYSRQRDRLNEELTMSKIDYHTDAVEELDV